MKKEIEEKSNLSTIQKQKEAGKIIADSLQQIFTQAKTIYPNEDNESETAPKYDLLYVNDQLNYFGFQTIPNESYQNENEQRKCLIQRLVELLESLKQKEENIQHLNQENFGIQQKMDELNKMNQQYIQENQMLKDKINDLDNENEKLKKENQEISEKLIKKKQVKQQQQQQQLPNLGRRLSVQEQAKYDQAQVLKSLVNSQNSPNLQNQRIRVLSQSLNDQQLSPRNFLSNISAINSQDYQSNQATEILESVQSSLKVNDYSLIIPKISKMKKQVSEHEKFLDEVFSLIEPLDFDNENQMNFFTKNLYQQNTSVFDYKSNQIKQRLNSWQEAIANMKKLRDFQQKVSKELNRASLYDANQFSILTSTIESFQNSFRGLLRNSNRTKSQVSLEKMINQIREIVDFYISHSKMNPNENQFENQQNLNYYNRDSSFKPSIHSFTREAQIINHFQQLFSISSIDDVITSMNNLFLEVKEANSRLQTLKETLSLDSNSSFNDCIEEIYDLIYYAKISKEKK
ncbi:centrosomal protein of 70 kda [Anaeramoeba ignava]|uniref:Centrosomal protein of 70 kDa n=1 Tax=Anaeramoeba ignava TaxID=1746090 RepID=A0A9Q0L7W9_ANAIG|nr:centrosomal protein of 70 kda [Anaeramoeba ignava]